MHILKVLVILFVCIFCTTTVSSQITTFSNPILDIPERHASINKVDNYYYLVHAHNEEKELQILKSPYLTDFRNAEISVVYQLPPGYNAFVASSFFQYKNELYLYFHMRSDTVPLRQFVTKAQDPKNPLGIWHAPSRVLEPIWNENSNYGAALVFNQQLYFVWSSLNQTNTNRSIYIAKMNNPTEIVEPVVLLREPKETWECYGGCNLEKPFFLYRRDKVFLVFTASMSIVPETSISYMTIETGLDPMQPSNWVHAPGPVFQGNSEESVYSTRFPEFTTSPDGTETWMLYTASTNASDINPSSYIRVDKIEWNEDGSPIFPVARGNGYQLGLPSGEPSKFLNPVRDDNANGLESNAYRDGNGNSYYMALVNNNTEIVMLKSDKLYDFRNVEQTVIYRAPVEDSIPAPPRIVQINGNLYIYFCLRRSNNPIEMHVIKAEDKSNPMQNWGTATRLLEGVFEESAYHGTVLQLNNKLYFVWASNNMIYIAPMLSPTEITEPAVLLKEPFHPWECHGRCINDFPSIWYKENTAFLFFAGGANNEPDTSLSYISIESGKDPLDSASWYKAPGPVFVRNDEENVFAPSHATFTTSPDGTETWMVYQASTNATDLLANLKIGIEKIIWDEISGLPIFPKAHGFSNSQPIPNQ